MSGIDIEGVLSAHVYVPSLARGVSRCACGEQMHGMSHDHRAHVAAVLGEQIEGALAEAWEVGRAAERHHAAALRDYSHWSSISAGPPTDPPNSYRAAHLSDTERAGGAG